jgi:hypothetical protein
MQKGAQTDRLSLILSATDNRLPGNVPFTVKAKLMKEATKCFEELAWDLFNDVTALLKRTANSLVTEHLKKKFESRLPDAVL